MVRSKTSAVLRTLSLGACLVAAGARAAGAQSPLLARADSAYAAQDAALARRLYEDVLRTNPEQSRAVFRLAGLEPFELVA